MNVQVYQNTVPPEIGEALERFEMQFRYPLGESSTFSISHGRAYLPFFQAIGKAALVVAEEDGEVLATLAAAVRPVRFPDGSVQPAAYLGDLKVRPQARRGRVLARVLHTMREVIGDRTGGRAYGVVMEGTGRTPPQYTGRLGLPGFVPLARLVILRIPTDEVTAGGWEECEEEEWATRCAALVRRVYTPSGGVPELRSQMAARWLRTADGSACGRLEDTAAAKRLLAAEGSELRSAHLSGFAFSSPKAGAHLLRCAAVCARDCGFPALFVAVPDSVSDAICQALAVPGTVLAPATVYGCGFPETGEDWQVDTAEI